MLSTKSLPNMITLLMGLIGSLSILLLALGYTVLSIRLVFLALSLDVLDGYLARRLGAVSEKGALLDRLYDRLYQVIFPVTLYTIQASRDITYLFAAIVYGAVLITVSFWRIAEVRPSTVWFTGIPFNIHTIIIISSYLRGLLIPPVFMLLLLIPTVLPIKYVKRLSFGEHPARANGGSLWQIRFSIPLILVFLPYDKFLFLFDVLLFLAFSYVLIGWIPAYIKRRPD